MHDNAERVTAAAAGLDLDIRVRTFPEGTRTALDAAAAVGTGVGQIVKSLVFLQERRSDRPVLALVAGDNRLDETKLAAACGAASVGRADADAVRATTGYPIGGVPPLGHPAPLPTFVDRDLLRHDEVWAAAGTPRDVFAVDPARLAAAIGATPADLAVGPADRSPEAGSGSSVTGGAAGDP
jgi:prolyl-tRNA editing enzyme YbaK/EbsC (Cys-tRNA(Pro) deacylase)